MIRALNGRDTAAYIALRRESFAKAPLAFAQLPDDEIDPATTEAELEALHDENFILGFFQPTPAGEQLMGIMGLMRYTALKRRHRAYLWGVYVKEEARGQGVAQQLLAETLSRCRQMPGLERIILTVSHHAVAAIRLYQQAGFIQFGCEPGAARTGEIAMNETYFLLDL